MSFMQKLMPDKKFKSFTDIKAEELYNDGIRFLISDIDNTLITYGERTPNGAVKKWLLSLESAGIKVSFISNNKEERVKVFNKTLMLPYRHRAGKPGVTKLLSLMEQTGAEKDKTVLLGDQIFTDVLCAKNAGIRAYLVDSLEVRGHPFLRFKKVLEKPVMRRFYKK